MRCARLAGILPDPYLKVSRHFRDTFVATPPPVIERPPFYRTVRGEQFEVVFDGTRRDS